MPENASIRIELTGQGGQPLPGGGGTGARANPPSRGTQPSGSATAATPNPRGGRKAKGPLVPSELVDEQGSFVPAELVDDKPFPKLPGMPASMSGALTQVLPKGLSTAVAGVAAPLAIAGAAVAAAAFATKKLVDNANEVADRLTPYAPKAATERAMQAASTTLANVAAARAYEDPLAEWEKIKGVYGRGWNEVKNAGMNMFANAVPSSPLDALGFVAGLGGPGIVKAGREAGGYSGWEVTDAIAEWTKGIAPGIVDAYERIKGTANGGDLFTWYRELKTPEPPDWVWGAAGDMKGAVQPPPAVNAPDNGPAPVHPGFDKGLPGLAGVKF